MEKNIEKKEGVLEIVKKNFESWNNALQTRNPEEVAKLYREDCVFLPTFPEKGKELVTKDGVSDYFEHFLKKLPSGIVVADEVRELSKDLVSHAGKYNFEVGPADNRTISNAKFTFIWKKDENGNWGILLHDSSPLNS